jgi:purine-binding chemotaxis protein CheW
MIPALPTKYIEGIGVRDQNLTENILMFDAGPHRCAIPCRQTREIVPMAATLKLPGQPPMLEGFLNLRGALVPIVHVRRLFGLSGGSFELYTPVIITSVQDQLLGLCVDRAIGVEKVDQSHWKAVPANHSLNNCAEAEVAAGTQRCLLLNLDRLLMAEERARLEELAAEGRRRLAEIETSR